MINLGHALVCQVFSHQKKFSLIKKSSAILTIFSLLFVPQAKNWPKVAQNRALGYLNQADFRLQILGSDQDNNMRREYSRLGSQTLQKEGGYGLNSASQHFSSLLEG